MTENTGLRPGGRSARVQQAVHQAVKTLEATEPRESLSVPLIAATAGVTPSTIYRRWGDLAELMADVSLSRLRPEGEPPDTGTLAGDLQAWGEQYLDEMGSAPGQQALNDIMASADPSRRACCYRYNESIMVALVARAHDRQESAPEVATLMDGIIAPMTYRLLYDPAGATRDRLTIWIGATLGAPASR
ncbi:TetR/AcrR family transcriptional regulator [Salinicola aestuarinus]|uniref:TetR/AcrR family transcriptional regulator n=1 Tax=Salinicola aestuarinus TaxID=1949082 RepID=UPI000DA14BCA|nr:TetR/AcrR family transcriptional regulator [Salinicola aestuarinus]